jgi:hypothetical protein
MHSVCGAQCDSRPPTAAAGQPTNVVGIKVQLCQLPRPNDQRMHQALQLHFVCLPYPNVCQGKHLKISSRHAWLACRPKNLA